MNQITYDCESPQCRPLAARRDLTKIVSMIHEYAADQKTGVASLRSRIRLAPVLRNPKIRTTPSRTTAWIFTAVAVTMLFCACSSLATTSADSRTIPSPSPSDAVSAAGTGTASATRAPARLPAPSPGAASNTLASVHSPGVVAVDRTLSAGQCHIVVKDRPTGLILPDPACTPGSIDPAVTNENIHATICRPGYTKTIRPPAEDTGKYKHLALTDYALVYAPTIEFDHLVPLELGGANAISNLWPEPNTSTAHSVNNPKDGVENVLNKAVCAGRVSLSAAQLAIATDWTTAESVTGSGE